MRDPFPRELCDLGNCYFVDDIIQIENNEVFIDAGAYVGDTINELKSLAGQRNVRLKRVVSFEPEEINFSMLEQTHGNDPDVVLHKKGLSDKDSEVKFSGSGAGAKITDSGADGATISVVRLDSLPECQDATWIKMDIEGAELPALKGAEGIIRRNRPKLTICIYHSDEDMLQIAEYIHELVPGYRLYVRHHSLVPLFETVIYAVP